MRELELVNADLVDAQQRQQQQQQQHQHQPIDSKDDATIGRDSSAAVVVTPGTPDTVEHSPDQAAIAAMRQRLVGRTRINCEGGSFVICGRY